jgi:hypothetical protein
VRDKATGQAGYGRHPECTGTSAGLASLVVTGDDRRMGHFMARARCVRKWPIPEMTAAGRRVGLPGWICRSCDLLGMAALDPMQNSRLLFSRDGSQFAANYPDGLKVFDVVRSH